MYFPSKRDAWLGGVFVATFLISLTATARAVVVGGPAAWGSVAVAVATYLFVAWVWFRTGYLVTETSLLVQSGPFRWTVALPAITEVRRTRNPLSSPALSLDRLEITYGSGQKLMISPADESAFLDCLRRCCPGAHIHG